MKPFKYKPTKIFWTTGANLLLNTSLWLYTFWQYQQSNDLIPLHYTLYFGIDLIDNRTKLFFYPALGLVIFVINLILAMLFKKEKLVPYFLLISSALMQILIAITEISLIINYN